METGLGDMDAYYEFREKAAVLGWDKYPVLCRTNLGKSFGWYARWKVEDGVAIITPPCGSPDEALQMIHGLAATVMKARHGA